MEIFASVVEREETSLLKKLPRIVTETTNNSREYFYGVVTAGKLTARAGPTVSDLPVVFLKKNDHINIYEVVNGNCVYENCERCRLQIGFVSLHCVQLPPHLLQRKYFNSSNPVGRVKTDFLSIRATPNEGRRKVRTLVKVARVEILEASPRFCIYDNSYWYKICEGYISVSWIELETVKQGNISIMR